MYLLDTNVISAFMAREPEVMRWLHNNPGILMATTTLAIAEIHYGLEKLENSRRRTSLEGKFRLFMRDLVQERIYPFTAQAAVIYGRLAVRCKRLGKPIKPFDLLMGSIAVQMGLPLLTRNFKDLSGIGIELINPWTVH